MAKTMPTPVMCGKGSDYFDVDHDGPRKEEVYLTFRTDWRGTPVEVQMSADRYRHSSGLSDWRIYASRAVTAADASFKVGVTDLARRRLSERCEPLVREWLDSDDYGVSRANAIYRALRRQLLDATTYGTEPTARVRQLLESHRDQLTPEQAHAITDSCDAFDHWTRTYNAGQDLRLD